MSRAGTRSTGRALLPESNDERPSDGDAHVGSGGRRDVQRRIDTLTRQAQPVAQGKPSLIKSILCVRGWNLHRRHRPDKPAGSVLAASGKWRCSSARLRERRASGQPKPCSPNYFLDYSVAPLGGRVRSRPRAALRDQAPAAIPAASPIWNGFRSWRRWRRANDAKVVTLPPVLPEPTTGSSRQRRSRRSPAPSIPATDRSGRSRQSSPLRYASSRVVC